MKTPTNFVPIIGPLYADDLHLNPIYIQLEVNLNQLKVNLS